MAVEYVRQVPEDMSYWLFDGAAPGELLRVLSERRVQIPGGEVRLAIIGSSHFLEIRRGEAVLTEMLASPRPGLEELPLAPAARTGDGGTRLLQDGLDYQFQLEEISYHSEDFERESERLVRKAPHRLCCRFPAAPGETGAVTCLDWQVERGAFSLETYHTFPGESTIVRSRTEVGFPEMGGTP